MATGEHGYMGLLQRQVVQGVYNYGSINVVLRSLFVTLEKLIEPIMAEEGMQSHSSFWIYQTQDI